jgi:hypothetical protein
LGWGIRRRQKVWYNVRREMNVIGTMGTNLPFIKARRRCPGVPAVIFTNSIWECATSTSKFAIPFFFSTVNEVEDGMPAIWVDL